MRALGVPARIVTGYQGTDAEPVGRLLRRAPELRPRLGRVLADGRRLGPRRPDRRRRARPHRPQPPPRAAARAWSPARSAAISPELLASLRSAWEAVNNRWNQWVLNYSRGQQLDLLKHIGFASPSWQDLALLLIGRSAALALAGAAWAWWDRHRIDPWLRQLDAAAAALRCARHRRRAARSAAHASPRGCARASARAASRSRRALDALERAALRPRRRRSRPTPR